MENLHSSSALSRTTLEERYKPLYEFFIDGLKDIYWAEKAIEVLLKKNKALAYTEELMDALEDHELMTHKHTLRLEKVFQKLNLKPEAKKCEAIVGIIKEAEETVGKTPENSMIRDAVIILGAQKIEHYEMASYEGLLQIALTFNMDSVADLLEKTLEEEEDTSELLSDIAESYISLDIQEDNSDEDQENTSSQEDQKSRSAKSTKTASSST